MKIYFYPILVTGIFIVIYLISRYRLGRLARRKIKGIEVRRFDDAVETDSPADDQIQDLREVGLESTENRFSFLSKALPITLFSLWLIVIALPYIGKIPSTYISIVTAIVSVLAGFALRPFLENLFAGVVMSFFKYIKIGDTVIIDGHYGLLEEIGLAYSVIKKWDWRRIVIPNSKMLNKEVQNLTLRDRHVWAYVEFFVAPGSGIERVKQLAVQAAKKSPYFYDIEEPSFWVMAIEKDGIKIWIAAWAKTPSDAWELRNDMRTNIIISLEKEKIPLQKFNLGTDGVIDQKVNGQRHSYEGL